jgi:hypothetical protein
VGFKDVPPADPSTVPTLSNGEKARRSSRVQKPTTNVDMIDTLGNRAPQTVTLAKSGYMPVFVANYHAPQGGGSGGVNQSGMDAGKGHAILSRCNEIKSNAIIIGDQNVDGKRMQSFYKNKEMDIISCQYKKEQWTHAAASEGLKAKLIDLGDEGEKFQNKADENCSDHAPLAIAVEFPEME